MIILKDSRIESPDLIACGFVWGFFKGPGPVHSLPAQYTVLIRSSDPNVWSGFSTEQRNSLESYVYTSSLLPQLDGVIIPKPGDYPRSNHACTSALCLAQESEHMP
ncbi:hypothetical protein EYC80_010160 [Monilinia laxa]|uniref:Uncharacterized protein n=1 Tax=Monilinia laxa TaxID=61186 RepID=A0A5N6JQ02_MONLA|nr:hypothetical protein EYC80_010160 [Monilinia laxa]